MLADLILSEVGNISSVNFLYHTGMFLLPYSPTVTGANLEEIKSAIQNGDSVHLTGFSIGEANYDQIVLLRTFVPQNTHQ